MNSSARESSRSLLLMLVSRFSMLGLESDQEEEILNSIEGAINIYGTLIDQQVSSNTDITTMLENAAEYIRL